MKRSLGNTLWIGGASALIVILLQKSGALLRPEGALNRYFFGAGLPNDGIRGPNYFFFSLLGFVVAWTILQVPSFSRRGLLLALLLAELAGAAAIFGRAGIFFQPFPAMCATLLAAALALATDFTARGRRRRTVATLFAGRLTAPELRRLTEDAPPDFAQPKCYNVSYIYGEIANQGDLHDEMSPGDCAALLREFLQLARNFFLGERACWHAIDGDAVRAVFGFPHSLGNPAASASRAALLFRDRMKVEAFKKPHSLGKIELRLGVSAGEMIASVAPNEPAGPLILSGEPFDIARRLAAANKVYGSQILLGPRAFQAARAELVARPLGFLPSEEANERLEIYELLALAADASPDEIARRDSFWKGLVYFRERRWDDALLEFNRARHAHGETDPPLQWYLKQLEPHILQMASRPPARAPTAAPL